MTNVAVGAPGFALALPVAPIAPDPFVPDVSTPLKLITVIDAATLCEIVAVTVRLLRVVVAKARQISEVPFCALVRSTSCQVRPVAVTFVMVVVPEMLSVAMSASSNSLGAVVDTAAAIVVAFVERAVETFASMVSVGAVCAVKLAVPLPPLIPTA